MGVVGVGKARIADVAHAAETLADGVEAGSAGVVRAEVQPAGNSWGLSNGV
jgi:hypothetical protein